MTTIKFTSEYFSGSQKFLSDKKAEKFLKMLKKNHDLLNKPRIVSNISIKAFNERILRLNKNRKHQARHPDFKTVGKLSHLKIEISHDRD